MDSLQQRLASASLAENLSSITVQIQANPADVDLRAAFVQLLCLAGNWNRAQTQLKSWLAMLPQAQPTVTLLQQAIEGEQLRAAVLRGEAEPQLPGSAWPWCEVLLAALKADIAGDKTAGTALRAQALESAEASAGKATTQEGESQFAWIMDGDSRFGPVCEAIANGRYYWIPFAAISEIEFQAPASVTDLVWRHTRLQLVDGSEQICQIPVRYPLQEGADERFLRASMTEWQALDSEDGQFIGHGQKMWLSDEADYPVLTLQQLIFNETELAHES